ncbi:putative methyltransferase C9orf114 [Haliotis cracherodii]|uniref:putative methyltransferase C9orf114 n=1 Tax=Haliotis cracherodii TaxID=6455 RepID=UPI0039EB5136
MAESSATDTVHHIMSVDKSQKQKTPQEWKKWKEEKKARKRKWKEQKLLNLMEKEKNKERKKEEAEEVRLKQEAEEQKIYDRLGRKYTVSIALPGSIMDNAQSPELRTYLAGQIARAAVVFKVDEIIIFDETGSTSTTTEGQFGGIGKKGQANVQMARILQYLECPQYLRKSFFPQHKDLQYAGLLNPLDCYHHLRIDDVSTYREGVVLNKPIREGRGSFANVGLFKEVQIDRQLKPGVRVTVKLAPQDEDRKHIKGTVVSPSSPRTEAGLYWGYSVRLASSLGAVFTECPYKQGYDVTIGTSERGADIDNFTIDKFAHALVVFGGVHGLEASLDADEGLNVDDPSFLFQHYLNTCPDQGSRTIRTEEAVLITMSSLRPKFVEADNRMKAS